MTQAARALPTDARGPEGVRWADDVRWAVAEAVTLASWWRKRPYAYHRAVDHGTPALRPFAANDLPSGPRGQR